MKNVHFLVSLCLTLMFTTFAQAQTDATLTASNNQKAKQEKETATDTVNVVTDEPERILTETNDPSEKKEDEEDCCNKGPKITGSVDTYYTYDFSGMSNIPTSFADDQNSVSIGMIDLALEQTLGKASFVAELAFGPRSYKSLPLYNLYGDDVFLGIQNLYVSYAFNETVSLTAGYMGTFVGYEVISPAGNFNYSTSYLFTNGPFQNAGLKADFTISDNFAFMVGIFNDWNQYSSFDGVTDFGAQVYIAPVEGWDVYLNFITGYPSGTEFDITTGFQVTDKFYLGLNAADYSISGDEKGGFYGAALYPQIQLSDCFTLGYRGEYFAYKDYEAENGTLLAEGESVFANTLTGSFAHENLRFLLEYRIDSMSEENFFDSDMNPTKSASQLTIAAVYSF